MRSNNKLIALLTIATLGGCSSAWWRDPPTAGANGPLPAAPAGQPGYAEQSYIGAPRGGDSMPSDWNAQRPGATASPAASDPLPPPAGEPRSAPQADYVAPKSASRYDNVGYASYSAETGAVSGAHATLPPGSFVEVTSLDTGQTILVPITASARPGREIELSGAAAQQLGLNGLSGEAPVRVRTVNPTGADLGALRLGRPAPARPQTPPVLLNALRRKLDGTLGKVSGQTPSYLRPQPADQAPGARADAQRPPAGYLPPVPARQPASPKQKGTPAATARGGAGFYVQIAALTNATRAQVIARQIGGAVVSGGGVHRIRLGPFSDRRSAQAARDDIAGRGYGEARIVR